jgi:3-deoxy-D-manno-octulosonic acid (KDO) 8-phosphate synthase
MICGALSGFLAGIESYGSKNRKFILFLSKTVVAVVIAVLFLEVYKNHNKTLHDSSGYVDLKYFKQIKCTKVVSSAIE